MQTALIWPREILRNTEKYRNIQGNTEKYRRIQGNTEKYRETQRNTGNCSANLAGKYLETTLDRLPHFSQVKVNYVEAKLNEQILNQNPAYVINPGLMTEKS